MGGERGEGGEEGEEGSGERGEGRGGGTVCHSDPHTTSIYGQLPRTADLNFLSSNT